MATDAPKAQSQSRGNLPLYPGWMARCLKCDYEVDLESLGWVRKGAYSYGKRSMVFCEGCGKNRLMQIIHVDENGEPDQSLKTPDFWSIRKGQTQWCSARKVPFDLAVRIRRRILFV